ncbi:MAG TPA: ribosome small subunit-dependent GTPase A [Flavisolibacter sp.]|jgi:ribosome biogenesis GTPase|nr:ribosome small subunit-dependent GTPase A [Flavisolibacter sp.]
MNSGTVYKSTGSWYLIKDAKGAFWNGRMKGIFKLDGITSTNPIAVGDVVEFEMENESEDTVTITAIQDRKNYINRQSPKVKIQQHIIAANVDQSILIATLKEPRTSTGFIDRFLVACEMYHVPAIILFNKLDLYQHKEMERFNHLQQLYERIGYKVVGISLINQTNLEFIIAQLINKVSLLSGHSGVGKSTFINLILPDFQLKTKNVSGWSGKGQHTTTFAEMFDLPVGGQIIDTPGLREFGLIGIEKQELSGYFPEMKEVLNNCQFNNCLHTNEPGCAVKDAVIHGEIDEDRYVNYVNILESIDNEKW